MTLPITDPVLIVAIAVGIFLLAPMLVERLRLPGIVGLILAGALVGPNGLNLLARSNTIVLLGTVGLLYLMFLAGVEIDLHGFRRYRTRSLAFGAISYLLPQLVGLGVLRLLGFGWAASVLVGSMFGSHTLLAYPIAARFGIAKNRAVTTVVGGTMVTDTAALLVLAVVAASTRGALDTAFWVRLGGLLAVYVAAVWYGLPRVARWVFRHEKAGAGTEFLFVLFALFAGAYLASLAGLAPIIGAFLVGLSLNRLIPDHGPLSSRLRFFGETFFVPFFLFSVGMLVDVRALAAGGRAWTVMLAMTATVTLTKLVAAKLSARLFRYTADEGWTMYGLSVAQAAATLAAALVGLEVGLVDETLLNGVILMILVTVIIGPLVVERYGRRLALREAEQPFQPGQAPQRIMVPMAKPASAPSLMDLALAIREPESTEPVYPLTVVPADEGRAGEHVALAERMLAHAVAHAVSAGVPVVPLTRVDDNFANGIARGMTETRTSTLVIGWDGRRYSTGGIFGSVLDRLLEQTRTTVIVAKLGHPLNTTSRLVVLVPQGSDHVLGFFEAVRLLKLMANRLGASLHAVVVDSPPDTYREHLRRVRPAAPVTVERAAGWAEALTRLRTMVRKDDLVVVLSARRGAVSWTPTLERLPGQVAQLVPESFLMLYLAEVGHEHAGGLGATPALPVPLTPARVLLSVPRRPLTVVLHDLVATEFGDDPARLAEIVTGVLQAGPEAHFEGPHAAALLHTSVPGLAAPMLFLATCPEGLEPSGAHRLVHLVLLLLSPAGDRVEHLRQLAGIAELIGDPRRVEAIVGAGSSEELVAVVQDGLPSAAAAG